MTKLAWEVLTCAKASIVTLLAMLVSSVEPDPACVTPLRRGCFAARPVVTYVSVANATASYSILPDVSAVIDLDTLFPSRRLNNSLLSNGGSIAIIQLLLVIVDWRPASVPTVPGFSGDK